jgi:hypothetical protein
MPLWLVVEYTYNRTYYRMICDSQEQAEVLKIYLVNKITYDSFGDICLGVNIFGPLTLNILMADVAMVNVDTTRDLRPPKISEPPPRETTAGDFNIQGSVVTVLQDKKVLDSILNKIDKVVDEKFAKLNEDEKMRKDLEKLKLPKETIDAMIAAHKAEKK